MQNEVVVGQNVEVRDLDPARSTLLGQRRLLTICDFASLTLLDFYLTFTSLLLSLYFTGQQMSSRGLGGGHSSTTTTRF